MAFGDEPFAGTAQRRDDARSIVKARLFGTIGSREGHHRFARLTLRAGHDNHHERYGTQGALLCM
jgi:hypothetical protein